MGTPHGRSVGLRDVAARAGVSVKTVSNVVNGYTHVSPAMRVRVQAALDELEYRPNVSARHLRKGRTGLLALAVPELDFPYFAALANVVVHAAERRGWTVLIEQTSGEPDRERAVLDGIRSLRVDGIIFSPISPLDDELVKRTDPTPMVLLGERAVAAPVHHVSVDNIGASRDATEHLIGLGARRIATIGHEPRLRGTGTLRLQGYLEALQGAGITPDPALIAETDGYHREEGARAMRDLLAHAEPPDAIFAFNDLLALGALREAVDQGLRVPEDLRIIGFDDIEECRFSCPRLSSVRPDLDLLAETALDRITSSLADGLPDPDALESQVSHQVVARESTVGRESEQVADQPAERSAAGRPTAQRRR
jgi:DNA-binding LacI/PurR family transcriptional regulator